MLRDEIEKILEEEFKISADIDRKEVIKEVDKHGLLNPENWDNPEAGFFDVRDYFKKVSTRILDLIGKEKLKIEINELGLLQIIQDEIITDFSLDTLPEKITGLSKKIGARINEWAKIIREE